MYRLALLVALLVASLVTITPRAEVEIQSPTVPLKWAVTRLTGEMMDTVTAEPDMPPEACERGTNAYKPVRGASFIQLRQLEKPGDSRTVGRMITQRFSILPGILRRPFDASSHLFAFTFEFENGYHTNDPILDAKMTGWKQEGFLGAVSFYVGNWNQTSGQVFGVAAIEGPHITESKGPTGLSVFEIQGDFDGSDHLSGTWQYREISALMGCKQMVTGDGDWEARPDK